MKREEIKDHVLPLFTRYPMLGERVPHLSFGKFPTPVEKIDGLCKALGVRNLYIKRDDMSAELYGGNKIRKLEFILAQARERGAKEVMTYGAAGSNHALATAVWAHELGMRSISMLTPQKNARYVRRNLLLGQQFGARMRFFRGRWALRFGLFFQCVRYFLQYGSLPQCVPRGGSSPLGTVGFVNAAFELKEQIDAGEVPEPELIYVTLGSMGTAVGLVLGLKAAGLRTRVVPVRVVPEFVANEKRAVKLFRRTNALLASLDPSFPIHSLHSSELGIRHDFFGNGYAHFTEEGMEAVKLMESIAGIRLEGTYTAKTFAALISDAKSNRIGDRIVVFWNTCDAHDHSDRLGEADYRRLHRAFHRYFENDVQILDN
jgi:1-aminocyclopropane-1-carboxylate deaminase/D-cysteine desulfhydrase-like pyridoxal-dependent ACC family enzyme